MLTTDQFDTFVGQVHNGRSPFPWQRTLLERIVAEGRWPDVIDVPTSLGKTSVLDIAVFVAGLGLPAARRRVFYVVDRRLVVDEAYEHAQRLSDALANPGDRTIVAQVAGRLAIPGEQDIDKRLVLDVTRMRGGTTWDRTWLDRPDRFAIVTGTVDQVGSRLLFRGYGVSERARGIDAALVGTDSLIVVDEAHLSGAFVITATDALATDTTSIAPRPTIVTMSATTGTDDATKRVVHRISERDERHPVAGARLRAAKRLHLVEVKTSKAKAERDVPAALAELATALAAGRVVGVVVNTVARARAVFELVREGHEAILLTGRSRAVDRDFLLGRYYGRISVDRDRSDRRPLIVVATQTVEVGANVDFDAMVTESAPVASLVQRLGRLNRMATATDAPALALLVHDSTVDVTDAVYGAARLSTWDWLRQQAPPTTASTRLDKVVEGPGLDASPAALRRLLDACPPEQLADMKMLTPYVPVLHKAIVDSWVRTAPAPVPDQPIEPFLHGVSDTPPAVTVIWRTGLSHDPKDKPVVDVSPATEEGIEVSIRSVRRWLTGRMSDPAIGDLDTTVAAVNNTDELDARPIASHVLRYRSQQSSELIPINAIRPGDTIVVPVEIGGCDEFGWHPTSGDAVIDVADLAQRRGRPIVRLGPALQTAIAAWAKHSPELEALMPLVKQLIEYADTDAADGIRTPRPQRYRMVLDRMRTHLAAGEQAPASILAVIDALLQSSFRVTITKTIDKHEKTLTHPYGALLTVHASWQADDASLGSSTGGTRIGLDDHQRAVARRAHQFASNLALPTQVVASLAAAARWHDEGKRDPRFQVMLWAGSAVAAEIADQPLAKSGMDPTDWAAHTHARKAANYPPGMRHEALSARIAAVRMDGNDDLDRDLVIHLIASHHGHARPLLPPITDPAPVTVVLDELGDVDTGATIDWAHPTRFTNLNATYGRWGLALLETVVRLADIWCSAHDEQERE